MHLSIQPTFSPARLYHEQAVEAIAVFRTRLCYLDESQLLWQKSQAPLHFAVTS